MSQLQDNSSHKDTSCPLSHIPASVWEQLFKSLSKQPWRKRHPFLFWGAIILLAVLLIGSFLHPNEDSKTLTCSEPSLALISIRGAILDPKETLEWIRQIEYCKDIKGVLVRVDSPGGGAAASQEIYEALKRISKNKKIAVSMGQVAASGGFMVSMAGERLYAQASTITGSIGVRMDLPKVKGLFDKLGIDQETLVTGRYKAAGSYLQPLTQEEKDYFQSILQDIHTQFVEIVAEGRKMKVDAVAKLATGRIFTGREALQLGLIDAIGTQEEAHAWLSEVTQVPLEKKLVTKPKKQKWVEEFLTSMVKSNFFSFFDSLKNIDQLTNLPTFSYLY
ncbi:MAG: signal peptide peptidase SppA [Desulfovibrionaceae bacterium]|nr:signal peptide peptidase SppA [Desulfovibrionaceae bacterium]